MKAIDGAREGLTSEVPVSDSVPQSSGASGASGGRGTGAEAPRPSAADALVHLASTFLTRGDGAAASGASGSSPRGEVVIHVAPELASADGTLGATLGDGTHVSAERLRRVACDGGLVVVASDPAGNVLDVGRRTRAIPTAIRRALLVRDRHCRFPGCANHAFLQGHHVQHWIHGGRTALENLVSLCSFHHRQVHEGGVRVSLTADA